MRSTAFSIWAVAAVCSLSLGCSVTRHHKYTPDEVKADLSARMPEELVQKIVVPYEINDEIRHLAEKSIEGLRTDREKTRAIVETIIGRTGASISYDWLSNKTAQQVFYEGKGNCLAYTNLFIGMARHVGLDAVYVDVTTVERVTKEAEVIVNNGHITAGIRSTAGLRMIDFTTNPERTYYGQKVIDDFEAIANYYNNQGFLYGYFAETAGDLGENFDPEQAELEMYSMALAVSPTFGRARNNLGVAYKRRGMTDDAIEQYQLALEADPKFAEARSNLASAYYSQGQIDEAIREFERAARSTDSNAYLYHHMGVIEFHQGNYDQALKHFKKAVSRDGSLSDARYYVGQTYVMLGERDKAIEAFQETLAEDPNHLSARAKLDELLRAITNDVE